MTDDGRPRLADLRDVDDVYQPAADSRLLADTATGYLEADQRVLDLGTGSGYVGTRIADEIGADVVASDVSPHACRSARAAGLAAVRGHLLDPFSEGAFDAVVFNAPYLPTPADREWDDWMETALSGGESGRAVVVPFLADLRRVLSSDSEAFLLISSLTGIDAVRDEARTNGLTTMIAADAAHPNERLVVLHLVPSRGDNPDA
jgi:release factor glutamine methyltransferase